MYNNETASTKMPTAHTDNIGKVDPMYHSVWLALVHQIQRRHRLRERQAGRLKRKKTGISC